MGEVIRGVLLQQFLQTLLGLLVVVAEDEDVLVDDEFELNRYHQNWNNFGTQLGLKQYFASFEHIIIPLAYWYLIPLLKFVAAMIILDTWQYFMHRLFHQNSFLYRHIHSRHHLLYVPYAFGALYNHPVEGFVLDSVGASLAFKMSGLATRGAMLFFSFATLKTVDDHCGYDLPFDPIQLIFGNNSLYHDIHHQVYGIKMNFSQPFFTIWDRILGTYMPYPPVSKPSTPKVETTKIKIFSLKDYLANGGDEINIKDFEKSVTTGNSPLRYNLRPRKAVSSL
ncbi:hypothetical protein G9A89_010909 [Geosiphon pyriformis]|nr:hypothetical protein G9A89_010909 [Geosiphon pyriformis]